MSLLWIVCIAYDNRIVLYSKTAVCQVNFNIDARYLEIERWLFDCVSRNC